MCGAPGVGKKSLWKLYVGTDNSKYEYIHGLGCMFSIMSINSGDKLLQNNVWSLAGSPSLDLVRKRYFRGGKVAICVFDRTRPNTLSILENWIKLFLDHNQVSIKKSIITVVENKIDLPSEIEEDKIKKLLGKISEDYNVPEDQINVYQTSVKDEYEVNKIFNQSVINAFKLSDKE